VVQPIELFSIIVFNGEIISENKYPVKHANDTRDSAVQRAFGESFKVFIIWSVILSPLLHFIQGKEFVSLLYPTLDLKETHSQNN